MRVAGVRYINAIPLLFGLESHPDVTLLFDTPSACCRMLVNGEADVGLVPVFSTQVYPALRAMKGIGIAAIQRTDSVLLFSTKPLDRVESVVTDSGSMTSANLVKIILKMKYNNSPRFEPAPILNIHDSLRKYDAALVIGDDAILTEKTDYDHYDLAGEWYSMTQLPFVFAFWAANRNLTDAEQEILRNAYRDSQLNQEKILAQAQQMLPLSSEFLRKYYNESLHYQLSRGDYEGLLRFLTLAEELKLTEKVRKDIWM